MVEGPPGGDPIESNAPPRLCRTCGEPFASPDASFCTACGTRWSPAPPPDTAASLVRLIDEVQRWRRDTRIDGATYDVLRADIDARLALLSPPRAMSVAPAAAAPPPRPPAAPRISLSQWASARQADLLLYLGAFLLVVAALVFVGGRGDGLSAGARLSVLALYTVAFAVAGLLVPRWERVREAGPVFLALGAFLAPLNILFWYTDVLSERGVPADWVWLLGSLASTALYGALYFRGYGSLYRIPAGLAAINAWEAFFAITDVDPLWLPPWHMLLALIIASAGARFRVLTNGLAATALTTAGLALLSGFGAAALASDDTFQLPVTLALLTAVCGVVGLHRGWPALLPAGATAATASVVATLWAFDVREQWWLYPPLLLGAVALATRPRWAPLSEWLAGFGWLFVAGAGLTALLGREVIAGEWHGAAVMFGASLLLGAVGWLDTDHPVSALVEAATAEGDQPVERAPSPEARSARTPLAERVAFGWIAFGLLLLAVSDASTAAGLRPPATAWPYLAVATALVVVLASLGRTRWETIPAVVPLFLVAVALAVQPWARWPGHDAIVLGVAAAELLASALVIASWPIAAVGAALGVGALAATWEHFGWPWWSLALLYAALASAWTGATSRWRSYRGATDAEAYAQVSLVIVPLGLAAAAYAAVLVDAEPAAIEVVVALPWYRVLVVLFLSSAVVTLLESRRIRQPALTLPAAALLAVALAFAWPIPHFPRVWLAPAYAVLGLACLVGLARWRRGLDVAAVWTWGFAALALLVSLATLPDDTAARPLVRTLEYRMLVVLLLATAAAVAYEARRLDSARGLLGASALAMVGVLAAIGMTQPVNVQWYTVPTALYLLAVGLLAGRRPYPLSPDVFAHEVVLAAAALTLVLPPAEQSFEAGAELWGLVVLVEGFALLGVGLVLTERWLAAPGVLSISGVAVRWLFEVGQTIPYWLTLGIAGLALLGLGLLLLFQREWWEGALRTVGDWWRRPAVRSDP